MINPIFKKLPFEDLDVIKSHKLQHKELLGTTHQERIAYHLQKIEKYKEWIINDYKEEAYELLLLAAEKCWLTQDSQMIINPDFEKNKKIELNDKNGEELKWIEINVIYGVLLQIELTTRADNKRGKMTKLQPVIDYLKTLQPFTYTDRGETITRSGNVTYL